MSKLTPQEFVAKWRTVSLKERSAAQSHFNDVCRLIGEQTPIEADPKGTWYAFEAGASKLGGGEGFADVWKKGCFAWEYKGKHANLDRAYEQLLKYRESLENPPLLIVSDMERILIHTNFTNTVKRRIVLELEDLLDPAKLDLLRAVFRDPGQLRLRRTPEHVTQEAASRFARLAELLRAYGEADQAISHFLIRLLFCLFAEDIGLLPDNVFTELVSRLCTRPKVFGEQLSHLFRTMASGGLFALKDIPWCDGGLFDDSSVLQLDTDALQTLSELCELDWGDIEPAILGTLFERSLDPAKRSQLGAHYTSHHDILLVVEPVLMAPLRRRWAEVRQAASQVAQQRDAATTKQVRARHEAILRRTLTGFAEEISAVQVLDPACGSGNFLYVALRQLLNLWKEVSLLAFELGLSMMVPLEGVTPHPSQLHGIETNEYAHELAQATIWIGYVQWLHENGFGTPAEPILQPLEAIVRMDAILSYDERGEPVEPEWPEADVIIGNPPFLGDKKMRAELGDEYVGELRRLYGDRIPGQSDLVCYWFEKARAIIQARKARRAGLLATQGIRGGANRTVLDRIKDTGDIFWAESDRNWVLDGATVHVSMVGFDSGEETTRELDSRLVNVINADLTSSVDLTKARVLKENSGLSFIGTQKTGPFDLTTQQARQMLKATGNPNGRPNSDVIKPWINATDVTRRPRGMCIIDFGVDMPLEEAAQYEAPLEHVRKHVKPKRDHVRRKGHREKWWLFGETRPGMRRTIEKLSRYIATPRVSKHRLFEWIGKDTVPGSALVVFARDDDYFFGILHSRVHELWARRTGTQLREAESGFRYSQTFTFGTFPLPWPPGHEPQNDGRPAAIADAARDLVEKRRRWLNPEAASENELKRRTLTNLYNEYPMWLELAHRRLDPAKRRGPEHERLK